MAALFEPLRLKHPPSDKVNDTLLFTVAQKSCWSKGRKGVDRHIGDMAQLMSRFPYLGRIDCSKGAKEAFAAWSGNNEKESQGA